MRKHYYQDKKGNWKLFNLEDMKRAFGKKMCLFTMCKNCNKNYLGHIQSYGCENYEPDKNEL